MSDVRSIARECERFALDLKTARANEKRSRLDAALRDYLRAEFWQPVDSHLGDDPRAWPREVIETLLLARMKFQSEVGRIDTVARTYACVPIDGHYACVLQISYAKVKDVCLPSTMTENPGGGDQVNAATSARPFSPSLCGE